MEKMIYMKQIGRDEYYKIWHTPAMNMVIFINSGEGSLVTKDKIYPIKKGTICFIGADVYHYTMPDNPEKYERTKFFFSDDILQKINTLIPENSVMNKIFSGEALIYSQVKDSDMAENLFDEIKVASQDCDLGELMVFSSLIKLMILITKHSSDTISHPSNGMSKAIDYINKNIYNDVSIDDICKHIHLSKYHFCREFKKSTGLTVMEYILKTRIIIAKNMLLKEKISVTEISNKCGFSSVSYFSRIFKKETGKTPLKYRMEK